MRAVFTLRNTSVFAKICQISLTEKRLETAIDISNLKTRAKYVLQTTRMRLLGVELEQMTIHMNQNRVGFHVHDVNFELINVNQTSCKKG